MVKLLLLDKETFLDKKKNLKLTSLLEVIHIESILYRIDILFCLRNMAGPPPFL